MEERICKRDDCFIYGVKDRGSDRWWERRCWKFNGHHRLWRKQITL